jgi:hypothetical protein
MKLLLIAFALIAAVSANVIHHPHPLSDEIIDIVNKLSDTWKVKPKKLNRLTNHNLNDRIVFKSRLFLFLFF